MCGNIDYVRIERIDDNAVDVAGAFKAEVFPDYVFAVARMVCHMEEISTLNLGNPEMYELEEVFTLCGQSGTAYFGHLPLMEGEGGESYLERLAELRGHYNCPLILVSSYNPAGWEEKVALVKRWHRLTRPA